MQPLVSICIPAYRQVALLKENLDSIACQTYKHVEVLLSDDSPGDEVSLLAERYASSLPLQYVHNRPALGSPANWNAVLARAKGELVLLFHHDDKFERPDALAVFVDALTARNGIDFAFARNNSIAKMAKGKPFPASFFNRYYKSPALLVTGNLLGVPSNVLFRRGALMRYEERMKWIVDIEYYTRLFISKKTFAYVDVPLVHQGTHPEQVTNECINNREVILYENVLYATRYVKKVKNLFVYDFYWRLVRNQNVRDVRELAQLGIADVPVFIKSIIKAQQPVPPKLLRKGAVSKALMFLAYATRPR